MSNELVAIIATAGRGQLLERTLASLSECLKPDGFREVIVVENGPKGDAEKVVSSFRSTLPVRYEYASIANKSNALNHGLEMVSDCLVLFTDDDVRVHPSALVAYASASQGVTRGQFYGGPVAVDYESRPPQWLSQYLPYSATGWSLGDDGKKFDSAATLFLGANWAAFALDLREIGGFDPTYGPGSVTGRRGQEKDAQRRLQSHGCKRVYVPDALVWHYVPQERCSPRWALERWYHTQRAVGAMQAQTGRGLFVLPRLALGLSRAVLRRFLAAFSPDPRVRFDAEWRFRGYAGYVQGYIDWFPNRTRSTHSG